MLGIADQNASTVILIHEKNISEYSSLDTN